MYRIEMKDLFAVQEEIAGAIVTTLSELVGAPRAGLQEPRCVPRVSQGPVYLNKWTEPGFRKSIDFFEEAIHQDEHMPRRGPRSRRALPTRCCGTMLPATDAKARSAASERWDRQFAAEAHVALGGVLAIHDWTGLARAEFAMPWSSIRRRTRVQCYSMTALYAGKAPGALEARKEHAISTRSHPP